jgi:uncharacterized membrane protein YoaK (UPF0700 family)
MTPSQNATPQTDTLASAILLATTGGMVDATVYVLHGNVFANAMTGNVILLGITAFSHDWFQAARHIVPICSFLAGVASSRLLRSRPGHRAAIIALILEMAILFVAGLLSSSFPDLVFIAGISFVCAFQVSTFRNVGRFSYNSTFITGNLRELTDGFINHFLDPDPGIRRRELAKSRKLAAICLFFLIGALLGAREAPHIGNRTFWLAEPLLLWTTARVLFMRPAATS